MNDNDERGIKLFEEFNSLLTQDGEEKQFLLQVVGKTARIFKLKQQRSVSLMPCTRNKFNNSHKLSRLLNIVLWS